MYLESGASPFSSYKRIAKSLRGLQSLTWMGLVMTCHITACLLSWLLDPIRLHLASLNLAAWRILRVPWHREEEAQNIDSHVSKNTCMRGFRKICQRGSKSDSVFCVFLLVDEGRKDSNTTKSGPSSAHQQNAIEMAFGWRADGGTIDMTFRWRVDGGPTLNAGLVAL